MFYLILALIIVFYLGLTFYASQSVKTLSYRKSARYIFWGISVAIIANVLLQWIFRSKAVWTVFQQYSMGALLAWTVILLIISVLLLLEDFVRFFVFLQKKIVKNTTFFPKRRKFLSGFALFVASIPLIFVIYGTTIGKYDYKVWKHTLYFDDLPSEFDGYKITQLSDIHTGSLNNKEKVIKGIDLANAQQSDVILITGDIVNNLAIELLPFKDILKQLKASDGVFSVMGNHDYGDYSAWETPELKAQNLQMLKDLQREMGFDLLLNEHRYIKRNGQKIAIVGVENWGYGRFSKYGNLEKALQGIDNQVFKILLSHDPSHWQYEILPQNKNIQLTLSGHTHGMQFGIEIAGIKWSPAQWQYKYWGGLYQEKGKFLNVNRGFGFHAFPGRIGIWPEITVIELRKKK